MTQEITKKLADITRITSDGHHFINMRFFLEALENSPEQTEAGLRVLDLVSHFHKLCIFAEQGRLK